MNGRLVLAAFMLGVAALVALAATDVVDLTRATWIGLVLVGAGAAIALAGQRLSLLVVGILVALLGAPAFLVDDTLYDGGVGSSTKRPDTAAELRPYRQAIGKLTVDLTASGLDLDDQTVEASVGAGDLLVLVPDGADIRIDAHIWAGQAEEKSGFDVDVTSISGTSGAQEVTLELEVGAGNIRVETAP